MSCQITFKNGKAKVVNENGTPSKLYADALALTKNQETALDVWATAYTPTFETVVDKTAKNDAVELKEVLHFLRNRNAQTESLSESEKFQLVQFMKVNGFENLSELSTRLNKIFRNGNFAGINSTEAYKYDLYTPDELKNINLKEMERLLVKIDGQLLKGDIEVVPQEPVNKYRNTDYLTILGTSEIIPQEVIDKDIENLIQDFNSEAEFRAKIQELPYSSFVRDFYENEAFAKSVMDKFKGLKRTPVLDIVNDELSNLKTNTFTTVKNTIQTGINKNKIQAEAEYLESIPLAIWMNSAKEIKGILREIEEEFVDYNIDLVGLENSYKDRQAVIDLLNSLTALVINPSQENILDFSQKHDALIPKTNYSEVQKLPENYAGLNIVKLYSEKSPAELYEKYALLKVGENLYHKVTRLTDTTDAYEYLYQEVIEDRLSIPKDVLIVEDFKDPINKPQVLEGISRFVNSRSTGIESPLQEEISLYQLVFNHAPLPKVSSRKNIEGIPQIKTDVEYLKTDFVSDFYNYTLIEKAKDSIAYRNVLSKFQINDKDITLVEPLETIEGIDYGQELMDYMRLKKDSNMQHLFENENEGLEQEVYLINNTDRIPNYSGTSSMDRQHLITSPNNGDWLKARGKFWRKVKEGKHVDIYTIANIPTSELYYNVSVNAPLNNEVIDNLLKVYDTPRENIVKPYVFPTIVQKIREKSNFIKSKVFEKNLVGFLRNKGIEVVTEENAVRRALEQSGIQGVNGMFDIANDLGVKETLTIKINNNIISVTPNPRSRQVNTREKAVSVNYGIYNKVVAKLKEKTGNLFRPAFVTKTDTTVILNLPQDLEQKVNNLQETYSEIQEILSQEKQRQQEADFENARKAEEKRGISRASLKDLGYNFLQTPAGNVLGFEKDGIIYLDDKQLNDTTTLHELIHVWTSLLKIKAERGDVKAQQILEKRKELFSDIASEWDEFHEGAEGVGDMNAAIISKKGAEELDRQQEVSFRIDNLIIAQELEKTDKTPKEIKLLTGWEKVNNEWVYEIPDIELKEDLVVELGKEYSVEEIVKDSELLQAYPELKNTKIIFNNAGRNNYDGNRGHIELDTRGNLEGGNGGGYQLAGGSDTIFAQGDTNVRLYAIRRANVTSNLSHESVHFAQWIEGLYVGGSPGIADIRIRQIAGIEETDTVGVSKDKIQKALFREGVTQSDKNLLELGERYYSGLDSKALVKAYESFAGEVMARNIQRRLSLTQEQKKQILLTSTEDVSEKDKIFLTKEDVQGLQQNLSKEIGLDLSSPAYARRPNETRDAYFERLVDEIEAYITAPEMAKQLEEIRKENPSLWEKIIDYISQLNAWLKDQIGLTEYEGNILDMTQQEYVKALGVSVLKDDYKELSKKESEANFNIIGPKGAESIQELNDSLNEAKKLQQQGVPLGEIEKQTGWYKESGDWKYFSKEMLENFKFKDNFEIQEGEFNYTDVMQDSPLLKAYPSLKKIKIIFYDGRKETDESKRVAYGQRVDGSILINTFRSDLNIGLAEQRADDKNNGRLPGDKQSTQSRYDISILGTLLHETSHQIQEEEGFSPGGHIFSLLNKVKKYTNLVNEDRIGFVEEELKKMKKQGKFSGQQLKEVDAVLKLADVYPEVEKASDVYKLLLGEVEARSLQYILKNTDNIKDKTYSELRKEFEIVEGIINKEKFDVRSPDLLEENSFEDDRVLISIATTIADINLKFVSLPTEKEQEDFYNKMDNCG